MPQLDQVDIQSFIEKFAKIKSQQTKGRITKSEIQQEVKPIENQDIIILRNEYESKLLQKDLDIRKREDIIEQVRKIVGVSFGGQPQTPISSNLTFWLERAGKGGEGRILKFLADKSGNRFTRNQIAFATELIPTSGSFNTYISNLKKRSLILEENKMLFINPEI